MKKLKDLEDFLWFQMENFITIFFEFEYIKINAKITKCLKPRTKCQIPKHDLINKVLQNQIIYKMLKNIDP